MTDPIKAALYAAAKRICICDGECYETRHGMMSGPCERKLQAAASAIAAFHRAMEAATSTCRADAVAHKLQAAAVERAAGGGDE